MQKAGKKTYQLLGKVLSKQYPELATELLDKFCSGNAVDTDFTNMNSYYLQLCTYLGVVPEKYRGPVWSQEKMNIRRLFISVMIRGYCPELHKQPVDNLMPPKRFGQHLSQTVNYDVGNVSRMIRQVVVYEKTYEDYKTQVDLITDHIFSVQQSKSKEAC